MSPHPTLPRKRGRVGWGMIGRQRDGGAWPRIRPPPHIAGVVINGRRRGVGRARGGLDLCHGTQQPFFRPAFAPPLPGVRPIEISRDHIVGVGTKRHRHAHPRRRPPVDTVEGLLVPAL
jgi:hypothetical protein